jgi:putative restriction endonuclease
VERPAAGRRGYSKNRDPPLDEMTPEHDEDVRMSCFHSLAVLQAMHGEELPYPEVLARGFSFRGRKVPFLNYQKGIYRAATQRGPAALSVQTSFKSPYSDAQTDLGFFYDYRAGSIDQPDNRALRAAQTLQTPIVHFVGTRPWHYAPRGRARSDRAAVHNSGGQGSTSPGSISRSSATGLRASLRDLQAPRRAPARRRTHRRRRRSRGLPAVSNGLSLCTIHHRAFDENLVGVSPDYRVHVSRRLLDDDDGPMLDVLKTFHGAEIHVPSRRLWQPNREHLSLRFAAFS